jgi:hypothetical protein
MTELPVAWREFTINGRQTCLLLTLVELLPETDLRWQVEDASNGRPIARFLSRDDAEQFMHLEGFLRYGMDAVPKKLKGMFIPVVRQ